MWRLLSAMSKAEAVRARWIFQPGTDTPRTPDFTENQFLLCINFRCVTVQTLAFCKLGHRQNFTFIYMPAGERIFPNSPKPLLSFDRTHACPVIESKLVRNRCSMRYGCVSIWPEFKISLKMPKFKMWKLKISELLRQNRGKRFRIMLIWHSQKSTGFPAISAPSFIFSFFSFNQIVTI